MNANERRDSGIGPGKFARNRLKKLPREVWAPAPDESKPRSASAFIGGYRRFTSCHIQAIGVADCVKGLQTHYTSLFSERGGSVR